MAVLIALHDLNHALRYCEHPLVIADGRLIASGQSEAVITSEMLRDIYRVEARVERCSKDRPLVSWTARWTERCAMALAGPRHSAGCLS